MSENTSLCCCAAYMEISLVRACSKGIGMIMFALMLHLTPVVCCDRILARSTLCTLCASVQPTDVAVGLMYLAQASRQAFRLS